MIGGDSKHPSRIMRFQCIANGENKGVSTEKATRRNPVPSSFLVKPVKTRFIVLYMFASRGI